MTVPCDTILAYGGELLLNEASLTGEALPIPKYPLQKKLDSKLPVDMHMI